MHSQAKLIQHLTNVRSFLLSRHASVLREEEISEGCICYGSEQGAPDGQHDPLHQAVKQLVMAEFSKLTKPYESGNTYLYPVRINTTYTSDSNYYGTATAVSEGYAARLALIDRWIADAERKLLTAVFRKALDTLSEQPFMCNAVKVAVWKLEEGSGDWWEYRSALLESAMRVLELFKPNGVAMKDGWYGSTNPRFQALRRAILNLCITEVTRGFK